MPADRDVIQDAAGRQFSTMTAVINSIPDLIFYKDLEGVYRFGNKEFSDFMGRPIDAILGKTDFDLLPADVATFFREKDREMLADRKAKSNAEWVDYPDGRHVLLDTLKAPVFDEHGELVGLVGVSRDITVRERGSKAVVERDEKSVREAAAQFYKALNTMFDGDLEPMKDVWSHAKDVTYMGPGGGLHVGWSQVLKDWEKQAAAKLGGTVEAVDVRVIVGQDLAITQNYEKGANKAQDGNALPVSIRATNIFRKEEGKWKMISHHTDLLPHMDK